MSFLNENDFRTLYVDDTQTEVRDVQILNCLNKAKITLEDLCGTADIEEVAAATDDTLLKVIRFRNAQEYLAVGEFLLLRVAPLRNGGVLAEERDLNNSANDRYVSFKDADARYQRLYEKAVALVKNYLTVEELAEITPRRSGSVPIEIGW